MVHLYSDFIESREIEFGGELCGLLVNEYQDTKVLYFFSV